MDGVNPFSWLNRFFAQRQEDILSDRRLNKLVFASHAGLLAYSLAVGSVGPCSFLLLALRPATEIIGIASSVSEIFSLSIPKNNGYSSMATKQATAPALSRRVSLYSMVVAGLA